MKNIETRQFDVSQHEFRAFEDASTGNKYISGYAAVYNVSSRLLSTDGVKFIEEIEKGSFRNILDTNPDVIYNFNHDNNKVFARTSSGTLTLTEDEVGLRFVAQIDTNISEANDLYLRIKRGDISENSFAFKTSGANQELKRIKQDGEKIIKRTIKGFDALFDVSSVTKAAYPETSLDVRSLEDQIKPSINKTNQNTLSDKERLDMEIRLKIRDIK